MSGKEDLYMRKTLTLSVQTEEYLTELREIYKIETSATRVTDGWIVNVAVKELYEKKKKELENTDQ